MLHWVSTSKFMNHLAIQTQIYSKSWNLRLRDFGPILYIYTFTVHISPTVNGWNEQKRKNFLTHTESIQPVWVAEEHKRGLAWIRMQRPFCFRGKFFSCTEENRIVACRWHKQMNTVLFLGKNFTPKQNGMGKLHSNRRRCQPYYKQKPIIRLAEEHFRLVFCLLNVFWYVTWQCLNGIWCRLDLFIWKASGVSNCQ